MQEKSERDHSRNVETDGPRQSRREAIRTIAGAGGIGAVAWSAPAILSSDAAAAQTVPQPDLTGSWFAQHTLAGSQCPPFTNGAQAPFTPNATATSWSRLAIAGNCLVWTAFGIGSNGTGTVIAVGDQNFRARWTGCGASATDNGQPFSGSLNTYNDIAANGANWVAVGNQGRIRRSSDDGVNFGNTSSQPGGAPALTFISHDHATWIAGGGTIGLVWRSTDNGANWANVSVSPTSSILQGATYSPISNDWFVCGTVGEIWRSIDDGLTWSLHHDSGADSWTEIDANDSGTVIACAAGLGRLSRSINGGATFSEFTIGGGTPAFNAIKAGLDVQWMAVGLANQIWYSLDDGATWTAASGLPSLRTWNDVTQCDVAD